MADKRQRLTEALNRYALRQWLSQACYIAGVVLLLVAGWVAGRSLMGGLLSSDHALVAIPAVDFKSGDSLFWFLSQRELKSHPKEALWILTGFVCTSLLCLLAGYLIRPERVHERR